MLLDPTVITKKNVEDVVTAGALTAAQICKGIAAACTAGRRTVTPSKSAWSWPSRSVTLAPPSIRSSASRVPVA